MTQELPDEIYRRVTSLSEDGNRHYDEAEYAEAIQEWKKAVSLLPGDPSEWEAATWLYTSIGDAHYQNLEYVEAEEALRSAMKCPDGKDNPFVRLRLGEALFEQDRLASAREHLLAAYMLEGEALFEDESPTYLQYLESQGDLDAS